jgi:hypothetical protein
MDCLRGRFGCDLQVEIQVRKIYCINRAVPTLPINLEDAARSEAEFEKAEQVWLCDLHAFCSKEARDFVLNFSVHDV